MQVDAEIPHGVVNAGGHRHLGGKVIDPGGLMHRVPNQVGVADIGDFHLYPFAIPGAEPFQVTFHTGTGQVVENENGLALLQQACGHIDADKTGTTGY